MKKRYKITYFFLILLLIGGCSKNKAVVSMYDDMNALETYIAVFQNMDENVYYYNFSNKLTYEDVDLAYFGDNDYQYEAFRKDGYIIGSGEGIFVALNGNSKMIRDESYRYDTYDNEPDILYITLVQQTKGNDFFWNRLIDKSYILNSDIKIIDQTKIVKNNQIICTIKLSRTINDETSYVETTITIDKNGYLSRLEYLSFLDEHFTQKKFTVIETYSDLNLKNNISVDKAIEDLKYNAKEIIYR